MQKPRAHPEDGHCELFLFRRMEAPAVRSAGRKLSEGSGEDITERPTGGEKPRNSNEKRVALDGCTEKRSRSQRTRNYCWVTGAEERWVISLGSGLEADSSSHRMLRTHQRLPSKKSCMLLMPRVKGLSEAAWRDS